MRKTKANMTAIVNMLERTPIAESACQKVGIHRSTYYRWLQSDPEFQRRVKEALEIGRDTVSDVAESQLISQIKDGHHGATKYWLSNNSDRYGRRKKDKNDGSSSKDLRSLVTRFIKLFHEKG